MGTRTTIVILAAAGRDPGGLRFDVEFKQKAHA